ncbi:MAG: hypothetical protein R3B90_03635 [Planctomycetaceae bacterium]
MPPAASTSRSRSKALPPKAPSLLVRTLRTLYQPAYLLPLSVALGSVLLWPYLAAWAPKIEGQAEYRLSIEQVHLPEGHAWLPADIAQRVVARVVTAVDHEPSLLDRNLAREVAAAIEAEPWVAEVRRVSINRDRTITIDVDYRRPVALVECPHGVVPVDATGCVLPLNDIPLSSVVELPVVRTAEHGPRGLPGETWGDDRVVSAARLAEVMLQVDSTHSNQTRWQWLGLREIRLPFASREQATAPFELVTTGGSRLLWGTPPGTDSLEPSTDIKLARLEFYLQQCGGFEKEGRPCRVDIRDIDAIYATALETEAAAAPSPARQ